MATPIDSNNIAYYNGYKYSSMQILHQAGKMHGVKRVATFCLMTAILPTMLIITPLYLRHSVFADVTYPVAESDVVAIVDGVSSIFCESHTLKMNTSFSAFQLRKSPELSSKRKHIRLKKSMTLPDDTLEYWGFYLLKSAEVYLKVCSRYEGSRILVVRGERNLRTCGLMEHNLKKFGATLDQEHNQVKVTYETEAQEIEDSLLSKPKAPQQNHEDENAANEDLTQEDDADDLKNMPGSKGLQNVLTEPTRTSHRRRRHVNRARLKRDLEGHMLDRGIEHGGTALNYTDAPSDESASSFERGLLMCYDGQILLTRGFEPSHLCTDVHYLEKKGGQHMEAVHKVASDGYYYYIFYSDNDFIKNDIHAVFDIYKPTFRYTNISKSKECLNSTECNFPLRFWSDEIVIVEVPTRDGIEHEEDDITLLTSTCRPRMAVYMFFPISVMFMILGCAFL